MATLLKLLLIFFVLGFILYSLGILKDMIIGRERFVISELPNSGFINISVFKRFHLTNYIIGDDCQKVSDYVNKINQSKIKKGKKPNYVAATREVYDYYVNVSEERKRQRKLKEAKLEERSREFGIKWHNSMVRMQRDLDRKDASSKHQRGESLSQYEQDLLNEF